MDWKFIPMIGHPGPFQTKKRWDGLCEAGKIKPMNELIFESTSHRQNNAELCLAAHHSRVRLCGFLQWISLNHGAHSSQFSKMQCVFGIGWRSCGPALNRSEEHTSELQSHS